MGLAGWLAYSGKPWQAIATVITTLAALVAVFIAGTLVSAPQHDRDDSDES
jgi:hypothetical protein